MFRYNTWFDGQFCNWDEHYSVSVTFDRDMQNRNDRDLRIDENKAGNSGGENMPLISASEFCF